MLLEPHDKLNCTGGIKDDIVTKVHGRCWAITQNREVKRAQLYDTKFIYTRHLAIKPISLKQADYFA